MRGWLIIGVACASLAAAGAAAAQPTTPAQLAAARAAADAIIAHSAVGDLFDNVTNGPAPRLRHKASGMVCDFGADPVQWRRDDVSVFPSGLPRGEDVGCNIWLKDVLVSMDITRFQPVPGLDEATIAYERSVMRLHPNAKPYTGPTHDAPPPAGLPPLRTTRYIFDDRGGQFSRLSVAIAGGWVVEERATGPLTDAVFADEVSDSQLVAAVASVGR